MVRKEWNQTKQKNNLMYMRKGVNGDYWLANYGHKI